jgi:hypothetical protein
MSESFSCYLGMLSPNVLSQTNFKEMWLMWRRAVGFRLFSVLSRFFLWNQEGRLFHFAKYNYGFATVWFNIPAGKTILWHDINQEQTEKLPVVGIKLDHGRFLHRHLELTDSWHQTKLMSLSLFLTEGTWKRLTTACCIN